MIVKGLMALGMVGLVAGVHAAGLVIVLRAVVLSKARPRITPRFWSVLWLFSWVPLTLIVIHLFEIGLWALFFRWQNCFADAGSSLYFAGSSYTSVGYGDLVLPAEWRLFGPLAALTGLLSSGLSVGFFVAVVGAVYQAAIIRDRSARAFKGTPKRQANMVHERLPHVNAATTPVPPSTRPMLKSSRGVE